MPKQLPREPIMTLQFFNIFRAVLTALVTAVATFIIKYFDQYGEPGFSHSYEYQ